MKNVITSALLLLALLLPAGAAAYNFEESGIYYNYCNNPGSSDYAVEVTSPPSVDNYAGTVIIPATVTHDGNTYSVISIGKRAFYRCNNLKSVVIPNSVTTIGDEAFNLCIRLENVNIPNAVTSIGKSAFSSCNLTRVTIPASVTSIGQNAFVSCANLTDIAVESGNTRYDSRDDCNAIIETASNTLITGCQNTVIPNSVIAIGSSAFAGCHTLESITIPNSIVSIGDLAFYACDLTSITIGPSLASIGERVFTYCSLANIVVESGNKTFDSRDNCNAIIETATNTLVVGGQNTIIPNTVTSIGSYAFAGCRDLISMTIPNSVTTIGSNVFQYCNGLENVTIPNSITRIPGYVFADCSGLTSVTIPNTVTSIGWYAFYGCSSLTSITIPHSVTTIGFYAFMNCNRLTDMYSYITDPMSVDVGNDVFKTYDEDYSGRTLHVPYGTVYEYQADEHWSPYFEQIVEIDPDMELIGDVNFDGQVDIADINAIMDIILGIEVYASEADVNRDGEVTIADVNAIMDIILSGNEEPEHEYVDLGLPSGTLWAAYNVGADAPEEYGDYFAWGETEPKEVYNWRTYKWCNGTNDSLTKYCSTRGYGVLDYKNELDSEDDAAYVNWGPSWCMPTHEQQVELMNVCTWTKTTLNGVNGYLVTGPNGNMLFFPFSGERSGSQLMYAGSTAGYWPTTLFAADAGQIMYLQWNEVRTAWTYRCKGYTVRAVRSQQLIVEQQNFDFGEVPIGQTRRGELTIVNNTAEVQTLTVSADEPFLLEREDGSASSIIVVVPGNSSGTVKVVYTATEPGEFNGNVTFQSPAFDGGERVIPVQAFAYSDNVPEHRYVDLGLPSGTLWATCNVGASAPEEFGDYFAWGEIEPKEDYLWTTYKWCNGSDQTLTKYCTDDYFGTVDNLTVLYPEDDAATVNWGSSWCMPTKEQFLELSSYCSKIWTTRNGVNGYLYIGPSGNTLFLPATGKFMGSSLQESGTRGYYWSRSLVEDITYSAWCLNFGSNYMHSSSNSRNQGITVRAVRMP